MEDDDANGRSDLASEAVAQSPGPQRRLSFGLDSTFFFLVGKNRNPRSGTEPPFYSSPVLLCSDHITPWDQSQNVARPPRSKKSVLTQPTVKNS